MKKLTILLSLVLLPCCDAGPYPTIDSGPKALFAGDSNFEGKLPSLYKILQRKYGWFLAGEAYSGSSLSCDGGHWLARAGEALDGIEVVVVAVGTNDLTLGCDLAAYEANFLTLLSLTQARVYVIVPGTYLYGFNVHTTPARVDQLRSFLHSLDAQGLITTISPDGDVTEDGVHLKKVVLENVLDLIGQMEE